MHKKTLAVAVLLVVFIINTPLLSQVVIYEHFDKTNVEFTRVFTKHFNGYFVNPKPGSLLLDMQIGMPIINVPQKHSLSLGVGTQGLNGFENFSFGAWGSFSLWENENFNLKQVVCRSTFNTDGDHIVRLMTQLTYKKTICVAPNLFRNTFAEIDFDVGGSVFINISLATIGATYWFLEQKEWWFMASLSF